MSERPHLLSVPDDCGRIATEAERHPALVTYRRPVGNMDPDTDPNTAFALTTSTAPRVVDGPDR